MCLGFSALAKLPAYLSARRHRPASHQLLLNATAALNSLVHTASRPAVDALPRHLYSPLLRLAHPAVTQPRAIYQQTNKPQKKKRQLPPFSIIQLTYLHTHVTTLSPRPISPQRHILWPPARHASQRQPPQKYLFWLHHPSSSTAALYPFLILPHPFTVTPPFLPINPILIRPDRHRTPPPKPPFTFRPIRRPPTPALIIQHPFFQPFPCILPDTSLYADQQMRPQLLRHTFHPSTTHRTLIHNTLCAY